MNSCSPAAIFIRVAGKTCDVFVKTTFEQLSLFIYRPFASRWRRPHAGGFGPILGRADVATANPVRKQLPLCEAVFYSTKSSHSSRI